MDELKKRRSISEINIKPEFVIGRQRSLEYVPERQRSHSESDMERVGTQKQKVKTYKLFVDENREIQEIQIEEPANVIPHRFANKTDMKVKRLTEDNRAQIENNPFEVLASCKRWKSSKEMKRIKDSLTKIDTLMDYEISNSKQYFYREQTQIVAAYNEVITYCDSYLQSKNPRTKNGKMRKEVVQSIMDTCTRELSGFEEASANVFNEVQKGGKMQWIDVLRKLRTQTIDMDAPGREVQKGGENTSEVLICNIDGEKKYFKKSEKFENITSVDLAYREIENAKQDSIEEKIKNYIAENPDIKESFEFFIETIPNSSTLFTLKKASEDTLDEIKEGLIRYMNNDSRLINAVCTDVESTKQFMVFGQSLQKNHIKNSVCSSAEIEKNAVLSNHNVATSRVANLLDVPQLIASSKNVTLKYQGETIEGNLMDEAKGETYMSLYIKEKNGDIDITWSKNALKQLYTLQLIDYLCGQVDRNLGNFMCNVDKSASNKTWKIKNITGIDNDMSFGNLDLENKRIKSYGINTMRPLTDKNGELNIPAVDYWVNHRLMTLTPELLKFSLKDLLSENALNAAVNRLKTLQDALEEAEKNDHIEVIPPSKGDQYLWKDVHKTKPSSYLPE